jgi:hypothetical protein
VELSAIEEHADIIITDMHGKLIVRKTLAAAEGRTATFDLGAFSQGMYLVQVQNGEHSYRTKIVVK